MFLRRIELSGFKSFADKTELEFVKGITAVVGPNGSGKSNISDAIRWVLGEQSAKSLRGGKMEDIIFAGSDARKAVNFAEISLTLDNADQALPLDFNEVTVTRRIHRSGDGEYFINKQACRLRDITELFMDTGIGREAYSIIGQGRIEEILSTRSEDRRGIFEEASGIVKYKSRKRESQKKLDETEQNLLRIHDLVSELEDQVGPLAEQSEKALQYKRLKEQLKSGEVSMYVHQIEQLHLSWSEAGEKLSALKEEQLKLSSVVNLHDAHLEQHRLETRKLEEELDELQAALLRISEEFEKCEGQGEVLKERRKNLAQNREQLQQSVSYSEQRLAEKRTEQEGLRAKHAELGLQLDKLREELVQEEERLLGVSGGTSSEREEELKAELLDKLNQIAQIRNEIRYYEQQAETLGKRIERLEEESGRWAEQEKQLGSRKQELEKQLAAIVRTIEETRDHYIQANQSQKAKQGLYDEARGTIRKWEQKRDALVSRRDTMRELQNDFDGFQHGVKEVLKARDKSASGGLRGVRGAVAELIKVPKEVETAVEIALGGALQHVVVDNEAHGREAIAFLKQRQLGRATFLPLDVIKGRSIADSDTRLIQGMEGYVGIAAELVQYDAEYRAIVGSLLGNVIISETLEQANRIAARCQYRYRVVTLEGDVVNAGGSMTGGSQHKKSASLLGRQRQIDELEQEVIDCERQLEGLRRKASQVQEEVEAEIAAIDRLRLLGEQKRIEEQQVRAEMNGLEAEYRNVSMQLQVGLQERESLAAERKDNESKRQTGQESQVRLEAEETSLQEQIRNAELARKASESAKEELLGQLTELKVQGAAVQQEKQSIGEQLQRYDTELLAAKRELEQTFRLLAQTDQDIEANRLESLGQLEELNALQIRKQEYSGKLDFKRAERSERQTKLEQEENETRDQRMQLKETEQLLHVTEVRMNRLDVELDNMLKKLSEEYEMSFELAKERFPVPEDVAGTQSQVRELKRQISMLGTVNLGAIEEYERVNERFQFLSEQKNDLIEAKTTLYQVIREMDEEMSRRFITSFEAIRAQFVIVFARLFGGGRADLQLSEPERLLETGIEIVAQPPGKKLQNLQLLSGGERALTAMALLFAILRVKPVPFCVLDEVEAALDEANVTRFADYLREFSQQTQFIVVTHRKGTMEEADVLYGVTMEEGGVSKLVSVRLEDEEAAVSA